MLPLPVVTTKSHDPAAAPVRLKVPLRIVFPLTELTLVALIVVDPERCNCIPEVLARLAPVILTNTDVVPVVAVVGCTVDMIGADELVLATRVTLRVVLGWSATAEYGCTDCKYSPAGKVNT